MPNTIFVLEAFIFDDSGSRFLNAMENGAERPWSRVHDRIFDSRLVLDCVRDSHPVAVHDVNLGAVKVSGLVQPKLIRKRNDIGYHDVPLPPITRVAHPPIRAVEMRPSVRMKDAEGMGVLVDNRKIAGTLKYL